MEVTLSVSKPGTQQRTIHKTYSDVTSVAHTHLSLCDMLRNSITWVMLAHVMSAIAKNKELKRWLSA